MPEWKRFRLPAQFWLALALIALAALGSHLNSQKLLVANSRVDHTHAVLAQLKEILSGITDFETAYRGYALTGEDDYLEHQKEGELRVRNYSAGLRQLVADNPLQSARAERLQQVLEDKLRWGKQVTERRRVKGVEAAAALVAAPEGRNLMSRVREQIFEMSSQEMKLLVEREQKSDRAVALTAWLLDSLGATAIVLLIWNLVSRRSMDRTQKKLLSELRTALDSVDRLQGLLPICAACKQVRDDQGYWHQVESYIEKRTQAQFTHGICPACMVKLYGQQP